VNSPTQRLRHYYDKNQEKLAIYFFIGGFLFDILMVQRIDSWETIGQQIVYLLILMGALMQMFFEESRPPADHSRAFFLKRWYYEYRLGLVHFFFGTLLNMYAIFFFKSSSLMVSFVFLTVLILLLIANESHRFKSLGLPFKFALLSLCFLSFAAGLMPIVIGSVGQMVFWLSVFLGCLPLVAVGWWIQRSHTALFDRAKTQILLPMVLVLVGFSGLYIFRLIPPIPVALTYIGVYHNIERVNGDYHLSHERPWWRFWHNGDQNFLAQRTDKIYVAFRVFSPTHFSDQVVMRWYWKDNIAGWTLQDSIPIRIIGGRDEGFRGYGVKSNYQPGEWKVQVETSDGREIGRVYFDLEIAPDTPRNFTYDTL